MSGPTWQSEAQRPHQALFEDVARRKQQAFDDAVAARTAARAAEAAQGASTLATGLTKAAAIEALREANAAVEAAEQRCRETKLAVEGAERQHGAAMTALAGFADVEARVQNARMGFARTSPNGEFLLPPALSEARAKRATAAQTAQDTESVVSGLRAELSADETALRKAEAARKLAKDRVMAVRAQDNERRRRGYWEELGDLREECDAMIWISQLDGPVARELVEAAGPSRRTVLPEDERTTPEAHASVQTHHRQRINAWSRALDTDASAELGC